MLRLALVVALLFVAALFVAPSSTAFAAPKKKQAAALSRRAIKLYKRGEYQRAAALFLEAFELSKRPAQLRNAAKSYEDANLLEDAKPLWERYLEQPGLSVDEQNEAKAHLKLIRERERNEEIRAAAEDLRAAAESAREDAQAARIAAEAAASSKAAPPGTAIATFPEEPSPPVGGYLLLGGGVAVLAGGSVLWFLASGELADVDDRLAMKNASGKITGITAAELDSELSSINAKRIVSGVLVSVGFASAAGGIAWLLLASEEDGPAGTVSIVPARGGAHLSVAGRF